MSCLAKHFLRVSSIYVFICVSVSDFLKLGIMVGATETNNFLKIET